MDDTKKKQPEMGAQERLSRSGDNMANVLQFLKEHHPDRLEAILARLRQRIPRIEKVVVEPMPDGNLLLEIKDAPFDEPVLARFASAQSQLLVTTHSPFFLDELRPEEVRVLNRDQAGHTQAIRASEVTGVREFLDTGAKLGNLWMEGYFNAGDPLVNGAAPTRRGRTR